ncbi:MAG: adenylate/guanylate cyclase domain-containing protein [Actinomycetota bacterium]|nr:adenylate/guanylate cyclase domain-containing protein [Actinomycetota bacterium]
MDGLTHTFVFADLVGFTALADAEGDERALEVVLALQRRVEELLEDHRAEQVKALGDGLMLRCERAEDAIALALRLVDELAEEDGFPAVRFGIHTGPAVSSQGDWYGRTVNVAARLCAVAPGGEVLVSETARAAAGALVAADWGERELHWLRNVSQPVGTYLASPQRQPSAAASVRLPASSPRALARALATLCPARAVREAMA